MTTVYLTPGSVAGDRSAVSWRTSQFLRFAISALVVFLGGCASLREDQANDWPRELPPASYFVAAYNEDTANHEHQSLQQYLYWVRSFYTGTALYPRGWNSITRDILAETPDGELAREREQRLFELGRDIAAEWSKAGIVNRVDNAHLAIWGLAAGRAVDEDNVDETLAKIEEDVQLLLTLELSPDAITAARYHDPEPDDFFAL